jgi:tripartite-type tricarboxylate transporter receptor subunit TctC
MMPDRRAILQFAALAAALPLASHSALSQAYPNRPIRWVVPYPAGGATDLIARLVAQGLTERLGQPVVIDNRPGAGTNLGTQAVVNAPPDGYTLLFTASTHTINVSLQTLPFNFLRDITLVSGLSEQPLVISVNPKVPATTLAEFIALAKASPGKINVGSFGSATISHLGIEFFRITAGINVVHVPYRGGAQLVTDLMAGQIEAAVDSLPNALPHIRSGAIRALATMSPERSAVLPQVPAARETIPGLEVRTLAGIGVPAGTPAEIIDRLNREINAVLSMPAVKSRLAEVGASPVLMTPAEAGTFVREQTERWAKLIKSAGIKAE